MKTFFVHASATRADGSKDTFYTTEVESKYAPLYYHTAGLMQTTTGYGKRIALDTMVKFNGKWRRVYCCIYSNVGTCYIGKLSAIGENLIIRDYQ